MKKETKLAVKAPPAPAKKRLSSKPLEVEISKLTIAPWNTRTTKEITPESVKDLADSIDAKGLLQRIDIIHDTKDKGKYIVCAGNRRLVACRSLGWKTIPADLFDCTEAEGRQITLIENLKRRDANPVCVAKTIDELRKKFSFTNEEIAAELGCETAFVVRRAKLIDLSPEWVTAYEDGTIDVTVDLLEKASRYTREVQKDALNAITERFNTDRKLTWGDVSREFDRFTYDLEKAPFPRKLCAKCFNNTACVPTLWDDMGVKFGRCLDKNCYNERKAEEEARQLRKVEKDGCRIVKVKDFFAVPNDHRNQPDNQHRVACVYTDAYGCQQVLYAHKDPTEKESEVKDVDTKKKERAKAVKKATETVKQWEKESLEDVISTKLEFAEDREFAAFMLVLAYRFGWLSTWQFTAFDPGFKRLADMLWSNDYEGLDRMRYIHTFANTVIESESANVIALVLNTFEQANDPITPEERQLLISEAD